MTANELIEELQKLEKHQMENEVEIELPDGEMLAVTGIEIVGLTVNLQVEEINDEEEEEEEDDEDDEDEDEDEEDEA